ncbi:hypothetical protein H9I32_06760 [Bacillus sp. Xin]|uniref:hypothetical protein n=1 Tax=unclassified Bacillus (in: firmicutes) TaxID=185979 RepID=UPI0015719A13|nr:MULTISPECIES: hypothetical protein [unclassified Bacillus (in: firmicutes)]MBC6972130.1 hypothetical protein [Bacillus sp. Xin]NSW36938.1 hypothetical protein [Bacillus sp. Xin1]
MVIDENYLWALVGQKPQIKKKNRTTADWDKLCVKASAMREKGMKYVEIAKVLGVAEGSKISFQLRKRG